MISQFFITQETYLDFSFGNRYALVESTLKVNTNISKYFASNIQKIYIHLLRCVSKHLHRSAVHPYPAEQARIRQGNAAATREQLKLPAPSGTEL